VKFPGKTWPSVAVFACVFRIFSQCLNFKALAGSFHPCGPSSRTTLIPCFWQKSDIARAHRCGSGG
jgi:hypothetical protein